MSCIKSFWKITLPGVTARLRPTSNVVRSDCRIFKFAAAGLDILRQHMGAAHKVFGVLAPRVFRISSGLVKR